MAFSHGTARVTSTTDSNSGPKPSDRGASPRGGRASRRTGRIWLAVAALAVLLGLAAAFFVRQAVERQRVEGDLANAAAAFGAARGADARELAPDRWLLATTHIDEAMAELHRQDGRFVLLRSYPRVHEKLAEAIDAAEVAKGAADAEEPANEELGQQKSVTRGTSSPGEWPTGGVTSPASAARDAAWARFEDELTLLAHVEQCVAALQSRPAQQDLGVLRNRLEGYRPQFAGIRDRLGQGDFAGARAQAEALKDQLDPIFKDLQSIATKFRCR